MSKVTAFLYMCIYITVTISQPLYPPSWEPYCYVFNSTEFVNITCNLNPVDSEILKLTELNGYTNNTADNVKYSVHWECSPDASVSIRATMQINKIYSLKVFGCHILNYFDYWNHESFKRIKDSLVYEEMVDCIVVVDIIQYRLILENLQNLSNDLMCGHDTTLKHYISRNVSTYWLAVDPTDIHNYTDNETVHKILVDILTANSTDNEDTEDICNILTHLRDANSTDIHDLITWPYLQSRINFYYQPECNFKSFEVLESLMMKSYHSLDLQMIFKSVKKVYPHMRVLNFSHNGFTMFPQEWKDNLYRFPKLEYIDYSYNLLADISIDKNYRFPKPGRQIVLDLSFNNITTLTAETVSKWTELKDITLDIRGNPMDCGCFKQDFINTVQDDEFFDGKTQKYKYIQNMTCASPATAKGIQIINLSKAEMGCEIPPKDLTIYLILLGVAAAIFMLVTLVLKFRKDIKLYLFVKFHILLPWDVDKSAEKKLFDAFISYSPSERKWVCDNLVQMLDPPGSHDDNLVEPSCHSHLIRKAPGSRSALSVSVDDIDNLCGTSRFTNLQKGIDNSRHTIVVLSRQFIKNEWSMAEFSMVYEESFIKLSRRLIIIKYEDIPKKEMEPTLKRCIRKYPCINKKDRKFIDRLRYEIIKR